MNFFRMGAGSYGFSFFIVILANAVGGVCFAFDQAYLGMGLLFLICIVGRWVDTRNG